MHKAFVLYGSLVEAHPDSQEAKHSRSQIQNIVNALVPKQEIMDALSKVARTHLEDDEPQDA